MESSTKAKVCEEKRNFDGELYVDMVRALTNKVHSAMTNFRLRLGHHRGNERERLIRTRSTRPRTRPPLISNGPLLITMDSDEETQDRGNTPVAWPTSNGKGKGKGKAVEQRDAHDAENLPW